MPRFEMKQVLAAIQHKKPTMFPGVPTIYTAICPKALQEEEAAKAGAA